MWELIPFTLIQQRGLLDPVKPAYNKTVLAQISRAIDLFGSAVQRVINVNSLQCGHTPLIRRRLTTLQHTDSRPRLSTTRHGDDDNNNNNISF